MESRNQKGEECGKVSRGRAGESTREKGKMGKKDDNQDGEFCIETW